MRFSTYFLHILPLTVYIFYLFLSKNRSIILFMKTQLILSISVVAAVSLLASCSSTKVQPDTYDNSETVTIFKIDSRGIYHHHCQCCQRILHLKASKYTGLNRLKKKYWIRSSRKIIKKMWLY